MENYTNRPNTLINYELLKERILKELFVCRIAIVQEYNAVTNKVLVQIVDVPTEVENINDRINREFPSLINVPIFRYATQQTGITKPINIGDTVILLFNDSNIDNFLQNQAVQEPATSILHDINHALAIPYDCTEWTHNNNATEIFFNSTTKISLDDKVGIANASEDWLTTLTNLLNNIQTAYTNIQTAANGIGSATNFNQAQPFATQLASGMGTALSNLSNVITQVNNLFKTI